MSDDIPTPGKGVYIYLDYMALGFILAAVEEFVRRPSAWFVWGGCLVLGAVFLFIGIMGSRVKVWISRAVGRFRNAAPLAAALAENADLKEKLQQQVDLANHYSLRIASWGECDAATAARGQEQLAALTEKLTLVKPLVTPASFGFQDKPERNGRWLGLLLSNDGQEVAYEVDVVPFAVGKWQVNFDSVLRLEVNGKAGVWINVWHDNVGNADLREHIIAWQQANGTLGNPVPFRIKYRDALENWFVSVCEFKLNVLNAPSGLDVRFLHREPFVP